MTNTAMEKTLETFVTFETAKLLYKAGFDVYCTSSYDNSGTPCDFATNNNNTVEHICRPTQEVAARWMRDVHNLHVTPQFAS